MECSWALLRFCVCMPLNGLKFHQWRPLALKNAAPSKKRMARGVSKTKVYIDFERPFLCGDVFFGCVSRKIRFWPLSLFYQRPWPFVREFSSLAKVWGHQPSPQPLAWMWTFGKWPNLFVMFRISAFFWHYLFWRWRWLSLFEDGEPFPQQVGDGSETSCPTLSTWLIQKTFISIPKQSKWESASSDLFSYEFFCGLLNGTGFGTGAWPTSHGSSNATGRHFRMLWCCKGLWLATNLLHVFSSCRFGAFVLGEIPSENCDSKQAMMRSEAARHLASPWPPFLPRCSPATPGLHVVFWIRSYLILCCFRSYMRPSVDDKFKKRSVFKFKKPIASKAGVGVDFWCGAVGFPVGRLRCYSQKGLRLQFCKLRTK